MKKNLLMGMAVLLVLQSFAQTDQYPEPEFSNEIYYFNKSAVEKLTRLEKDNSKMENKVKLMGMGGMENGYAIEGVRSPVRFSSGTNLSFIISTGAKQTARDPKMDSMMRAQGMDPEMMSAMRGGMMDPANMITLYKAEVAKEFRKIYLMKMGSMINPFASKKSKSSDKFTFSVRKIRDGYWELVIDKKLPSGEYAFSYSGMSMDGGVTIYAFGID